MMKVLINCAFTLLILALYDHYKVDEIGQPIAVVNFDAVYSSYGDSAKNEDLTLGIEELQKDAIKLVGAGFVVLDSRALIGYPAAVEVPVAPPNATPSDEQETEIKGSEIKAGALDE
jgi:hypothetical protein